MYDMCIEIDPEWEEPYELKGLYITYKLKRKYL